MQKLVYVHVFFGSGCLNVCCEAIVSISHVHTCGGVLAIWACRNIVERRDCITVVSCSSFEGNFCLTDSPDCLHLRAPYRFTHFSLANSPFLPIRAVVTKPITTSKIFKILSSHFNFGIKKKRSDA